jgi:arylsulfatase
MRLALATAAILAACLAPFPARAADERPNIVLIIGDDHAYTDYGFMGNPDVRTPQIDRLAADGLTFTRGYVTTALCSPSLATLLTGLHPHQHGITGNDPSRGQRREPWLDRFFRHPMLPKLLADAGYVTMHTGKYWMRKPADAGFTRDMGSTGRHGGDALAIGRETMRPIYEAIDAARRDAKPFFVWYAPLLPHDPHDPPRRLLDKYAAIQPPARAKYYAMIEWLDETVGDLMSNLASRGIAENTLVVYLNDNGWNEFGKLTPYENGVRTPVVLRWPKQIAPKIDRERLAGNIDVMPTLLAAAGVPLPPGLPGVNLLDAKATAARETLFLANYTHDMAAPDDPGRSLTSRTCIHRNWKLIEWREEAPGESRRSAKPRKNPGARVELFDLSLDPGEKKNLAGAERERVADLSARLDAWWKPSGEPAGTARRPNIVFVLTDDQGYGDISAHGNPVLRTPNLDRLHAESVRFTDFHVSPTCSPTRSALMTGRHEFKNGVTHTILERERLTPDATTIAEVLKGVGYATGIFGKWHLGDEDAYQPGRRGFDEVFIHGGGGIGQTFPGSCGDAPRNAYFDPAILHNGTFEKTKGYCTDVFFGQAVSWMDAQRAAGRPFFAYIATNAPHSPLVARPEDKAIYRGKGLSAGEQSFFGMIHNIDENIGRLLAKLDAWGIAEETLVIFMNDNGGATGAKRFNAGMRGSKGTPWLGGTRASSFWRWRSTYQPADCAALAAHVDFFPTIAEIARAPVPDPVRPQVEGRSLVPLLNSPGAPWPDRILFTHRGRWPKGADPNAHKFTACAARNTRWALVSENGGSEPEWQLFDVASDPGQRENVIAAHPEVAKELAAAFDRWWAECLPGMVNEQARGPKVNPFHERYYKQFGGQPAPRDRKKPGLRPI